MVPGPPDSGRTASRGPRPDGRGAWGPDACEVAIIGGGLAGSALAVHLARAGRGVALFERDRFPRDKLCGEFLSPESSALLRDLGCLAQVLERGAVPIRQARLSSVRGRVLEVPLPGEGLGISRAALDEILFKQAAACGAGTFEASEVKTTREGGGEGTSWLELDVEQRSAGDRPARRVVTARCLVGAYGREGRLGRTGGDTSPHRSDPCVGLKKHHRPAANTSGDRLREELRGTVEIHTVDGGYCGLSFVEDDTVNVCMLLRKKTLTSLTSPRWPDVRHFLESQNPVLAQRLNALVPTDRPLLAVGRIPAGVKEPAHGHVLCVGDAAGMIAPLCGDGQAMALSSAKLLATLFARLPGDIDSAHRERLGRDWRRQWRKHYTGRLRLGRWLQRVVLEPRLAHGAFAVLARFPGLTRRLVRCTREGAMTNETPMTHHQE